MTHTPLSTFQKPSRPFVTFHKLTAFLTITIPLRSLSMPLIFTKPVTTCHSFTPKWCKKGITPSHFLPCCIYIRRLCAQKKAPVATEAFTYVFIMYHQSGILFFLPIPLKKIVAVWMSLRLPQIRIDVSIPTPYYRRTYWSLPTIRSSEVLF